MRVLVAGGAGLIGGHLCRALLARADAVVLVDNLSTGSSETARALAAEEGCELVEADVTAPLDLHGPLDAVVNLACPASPADFERLPMEILAAGSAGVANLVGIAYDHGAFFLQASTSEVYGDPAVSPQPEGYWGNVNPVGPRSVYDESKRFGEAMVAAWRRHRGLAASTVRIFNTYGPGMRPDDGRLVSNFVTQALRGEPLSVYGDGGQTRSLCYVGDLVAGLLAVLDTCYPGPVNLGSDDERSVSEVARIVLELTGSKAGVAHRPLPPDDPRQRRPDLTLARRHLGWAPSTPLEAGLAATVEWFASGLAG